MMDKQQTYPNLSELRMSIIRELMRVWNSYPEMRFGQVVGCATVGQPPEKRSLYLLEDEAALRGLKNCTSRDYNQGGVEGHVDQPASHSGLPPSGPLPQEPDSP